MVNGMNGKNTVVMAFSGGLDTSFCVGWLKENVKCDVVTVTVDTGGFSKEELEEIGKRAYALGAVRHYAIDGRQAVYDRFASYLIKGNVLRGGIYPLCVSSERAVQAEETAKIAIAENADGVAHGSTGAGNDQARFDIAFRVLVPKMKIYAPIRELGLSREKEAEYLAAHGVKISAERKKYSINKGLWGTTIGGGETHSAMGYPPEEAFTRTSHPEQWPDKPEDVMIGFERGLPVSLNGKDMGSIALVDALDAIGGKHGCGRGIHLGDTILGIKGRIAFEAPAPLILVAAHRELEKLVLTKAQMFWKGMAADAYGSMLHEGLQYDPAHKDVMALIDSSQRVVSGTVKVRLFKGGITVLGCESRHSLMDAGAVYGEGATLWDGRDAEGFCRIYGLQSALAKKVGQ
jgi:argininosuccinate synthase